MSRNYKLSEKIILIAGGAGFIGSHLCEALAEKNPRGLIVVDNLFLGKERNLEKARELYPKLKFYKDSASDYKRIGKIISENGVEIVFNLAVLPLPASLVKPKMTCGENISIILNLCELAKQKYFNTLIHCSSSEVYGSACYVPMDEKHPFVPSTPYAASKIAGDYICLSYAKIFNIDISIVRPFNNYGPRQNDGSYAGLVPRVIKKILKGEPVEIYGDGNQTRDFIFVEDTARALMAAYESRETRNRAINIATGKEISVNRVVKIIMGIMKAKCIKIKYINSRPADVRRHLADISLAKGLISFKPSIKFEDGLRKTIEWYVQKPR